VIKRTVFHHEHNEMLDRCHRYLHLRTSHRSHTQTHQKSEKF
jgi:hypothetical protein